MSKKTKKNKFNIYLMVISLFLSWLALTNTLLFIKYDILPLKYFLPFLIILIIIPSILVFLMLKRKIKPKIKGILSGISILFIIIFIVMLFYLNKTFDFINKLGETGYKTENYSVLVLSDSSYETLDDIKDKNLGYYLSDDSHTEEALEKLEEVITINKVAKDDYSELVNSLYTSEFDAIIIEESYRGIIEETDEAFTTKTKVIYTIEIKIKTEDITKNVNVNEDTFNIYISGIDTYGNISSVSRSDVNIIATVNPNSHQILLTTIPRDYYVQLDGTTGYKDKLTHAGIYGIDKSIKTIENLLDIEINYYVKVNFSSLEKLVNALNGVDVYSEETFTGFLGTNFKRGYNRVNGDQALEFARTRKTVSGGDRTRGINQQALIQAIINKACSKDIITKYTNILNSLEGSFQTNMSTDEITDIIKRQIADMKGWNITSISLDGTNGYEYTYSYKNQKLYVMIPLEETIGNAKEKIEQVTNGELLASSYTTNNGNVNIPTTSYIPEYSNDDNGPVENNEEVIKEPDNNEIEDNLNETTDNKDTTDNKENNNEKEQEEDIDKDNDDELPQDEDDNQNDDNSAIPDIDENINDKEEDLD